MLTRVFKVWHLFVLAKQPPFFTSRCNVVQAHPQAPSASIASSGEIWRGCRGKCPVTDSPTDWVMKYFCRRVTALPRLQPYLCPRALALLSHAAFFLFSSICICLSEAERRCCKQRVFVCRRNPVWTVSFPPSSSEAEIISSIIKLCCQAELSHFLLQPGSWEIYILSLSPRRQVSCGGDSVQLMIRSQPWFTRWLNKNSFKTGRCLLRS